MRRLEPRLERNDSNTTQSTITNSHFHARLRSLLARDTSVPRFKIFYSNTFSRSPGLPIGHPWNNLPRGSGLEAVGSSAASIIWNGKPKGKMRNKDLEGTMKTMVGRHERMDYGRAMERFCPLGRIWGRRKFKQRGNKELDISTVAKLYTRKEDVVRFIIHCVGEVCPPDLFGSPGNWDVVLSGVKEFVKARTSEGFDVRMMAEGIKTDEVSWLKTKNRPTQAQSILKVARVQVRGWSEATAKALF